MLCVSNHKVLVGHQSQETAVFANNRHKSMVGTGDDEDDGFFQG
jgi:hypothetical protein